MGPAPVWTLSTTENSFLLVFILISKLIIVPDLSTVYILPTSLRIYFNEFYDVCKGTTYQFYKQR